MSARSLSESVSQSSSPSRPFSANVGAWRVELLKQTLPRPPSPPRATSRRWPSTHEVAQQLALGVAHLGADGHLHEQLRPVGAALVGAAAGAAVGGAEVVLVAEVARSWSWRVATSTTSPPGAPSPPSGPPLGTYFSRRKLMEPLPPRPARTQMLALSSMMKNGPADAGRRSGLGDDRDEAAGALLG